jgi:transcriptional regulator with XRE-family HTH domain
MAGVKGGPMDEVGIGIRLTQERERAGLTQTGLATVTGIDRDKINKIEHHKRDVSITEALVFAAALGISPEDLAPRPTRVQYRRQEPSDDMTPPSIPVFEAFIENWRMLDGLERLDED